MLAVVISLAEHVEAFSSMANNTLVDVKDVLNDIRPVVDVAREVLDNTDVAITKGVTFIESINPLLPPLREARAFMTRMRNLTFIVQNVVKFIEPITGTVEKFLRSHLMQKELTVRQFLVTVQVYIGKFESLSDLVRSTVSHPSVDVAHAWLVTDCRM